MTPRRATPPRASARACPAATAGRARRPPCAPDASRSSARKVPAGWVDAPGAEPTSPSRARPTPTDRNPASSSPSPTRAARASRADSSANSSSISILAAGASATRARWARDTRCATSARDAEACRGSHTPCGATNPRRTRSGTSRGRATSRAATTPRGEYIRTRRGTCRWRTRPNDGACETSGSPAFARFEGTKAAGKGDETKGVPTGTIRIRSRVRARGVAPSSGPPGCSAAREGAAIPPVETRRLRRAQPLGGGCGVPASTTRSMSISFTFWFADAFAIARD